MLKDKNEIRSEINAKLEINLNQLKIKKEKKKY